MPLRDHFRPPISRRATWEAIHGQWPAVIVQQLKSQLPPGYVSAPKVHLGSYIEIDIVTYEEGGGSTGRPAANEDGTAAWSAAEPSLAVETDVPDDDG
jgi:hypothetical protein